MVDEIWSAEPAEDAEAAHLAPGMESRGPDTTVDPLVSDESVFTCQPTGLLPDQPSTPREGNVDVSVIHEQENVTRMPFIHDLVYTFLYNCTRRKVMNIARSLGCTIRGKKSAVLKRVYLQVLTAANEEDTNVIEIMCKHAAGIHVPFPHGILLKPSTLSSESLPSGYDWRVAPGFSSLQEGDGDCPESSEASLLSDFARLIATLFNDDALKKAMLEGALDMTPEQIDRGVSRGALWSTSVERLFNDPDWKPNLPVCDVLDDCDPSFRHGRPRSGPELKGMYRETRSSFKLFHERWSRSEKKDPDAFPSFLSSGPNGAVSIASKRVLVMFAGLRCGTPSELTDVLHFMLRWAPVDTGRKDGTGTPNVLARARRAQMEFVQQSHSKRQKMTSGVPGEGPAFDRMVSATTTLCATLTPTPMCAPIAPRPVCATLTPTQPRVEIPSVSANEQPQDDMRLQRRTTPVCATLTPAPLCATLTPTQPRAEIRSVSADDRPMEDILSKCRTMRDLGETIRALEPVCTAEEDAVVIARLRSKLRALAGEI